MFLNLVDEDKVEAFLGGVRIMLDIPWHASFSWHCTKLRDGCLAEKDHLCVDLHMYFGWQFCMLCREQFLLTQSTLNPKTLTKPIWFLLVVSALKGSRTALNVHESMN
ncbi:unnamed protein product [Durusdinium trenchii]|uniref:Uncharacterized protein n=1 Tax=Durusdinium trenchii TaxID=1381693 RepID=A0ABP0Q7G2_9DINO